MQKRELTGTIILTLSLFILSSFPLFLSFLLKIFNPSNYGLILGTKHDLEFTYKELVFFASNMLCLFIISTSLRYIEKRSLRRVAAFLPILYLCLSFLFILTDALNYLIFSYPLTFSVIQTIINSNPDEARDFIRLYSSTGVIIALILSVAFIIIIVWKRYWFRTLLKSKSFFITSLLVSLYGLVHLTVLGFVVPGNIYTNVRYWDITIGEYEEFRKFSENMKAEKDNINLSPLYHEFAKRDTLNKTLVLIISESLSKKHMSLYGYERNTTPFLSEDANIIKFNDCVTSAALTTDAVPALFFDDETKREINLITLLNKLGYETSWISNQSGWGRKDAPIVLLSQLCTNNLFNDILKDNDAANMGTHYDEEIIDDFEMVLNRNSGKSKFIVLHLMGCHFDYDKRYPTDRIFFTSTPPTKAVNTKKSNEIINSYDNAVRYHDSVVNCLLRMFSKHAEHHRSNSALIFMSDHGEELFDKSDYFGHCYPPRKDMAEIPYFVKLSPTFSANFRQTDSIAKRRTNTAYSTVNNFYTVLQILNINSERYQDKIQRNAFFSPMYDSTNIRYVMGCDYKKM